MAYAPTCEAFLGYSNSGILQTLVDTYLVSILSKADNTIGYFYL